MKIAKEVGEAEKNKQPKKKKTQTVKEMGGPETQETPEIQTATTTKKGLWG